VTRNIADLAWPLTTERLSLRPAEMTDALPTFAFRSRPEIAQWLTNFPQDPDVWEAGFRDRVDETLIVEKDGVVIGDLYLHVQDPWSQAEMREQAARTQAEIGYVFDPAYAGQGYATEACREELRICFEDIGVRRVIAQCFADNVPSWRLMERLGMRREQHTKKDSLHRNGEWLDGMMYAILADEWTASQQGSQPLRTAAASTGSRAASSAHSTTSVPR
jgi:RimJ/RimL family protein N-acetyltransferase